VRLPPKITPFVTINIVIVQQICLSYLLINYQLIKQKNLRHGYQLTGEKTNLRHGYQLTGEKTNLRHGYQLTGEKNNLRHGYQLTGEKNNLRHGY
jgi:hypothetical protein